MGTLTRLRVWKGEVDISDAIELRQGRALPGGWSQHEIVYVTPTGLPEHVGWLESGYPSDMAEGFRWAVETMED